MKDPNMSLAQYGIRTGSKIMMIGDNSPPSTSSPAPSSRSGTPQQDQNKPPAVDMKNEDSVVNLIDFHMDYITTTVMPIVEEYVAKATEYLETGDITTTDTASRPASAESGTTPNAPKKLADLHAKAAELLLQRLLKIDAVELEPGFDRARSRRREAVRFVQGQLDKIDGIKERVKAAVASKKGLL
ncbi:uncharacterized protein EV422DRAFT_585359 [Fimicolochytrium jonesii]|uniref:uncharacterized protein n=1 Tax=Fimicolochytrium jonesii TaxID=1396493 RepID=UPI0022FEC384|nr:uncharacterized protein EV422DRAFT_585359 [Fimicolochytrium jonesii]KAI8822856.1 hypothetical protein EV422DRAFT_585359 [Fimicolochytrium jonesii]